ncbi:MAG: hypothetical protein K5697_12075 [Lachnospiraceae bacterium]|nr:hypothetical protein [Lachnospiraceae bacterium]
MAKRNGLKMVRQLQIYDLIYEVYNDAVYGPEDIMSRFGISRRMLQRDLKDLRDCGLISVKYNREKNRYVPADDRKPDEPVPPRRSQHLNRLYRIGTLIRRLSSTDAESLELFGSELEEYLDYVAEAGKHPSEESPDDIADMRRFIMHHDIEFYDLKAEYYELFPDSNERTRQRDFKEMNRAGFRIYYSRRYGAYIYEAPQSS